MWLLWCSPLDLMPLFCLPLLYFRWKLPLFRSAKAPVTRATLTNTRRRKSESPSQRNVQRSSRSSSFQPRVAERGWEVFGKWNGGREERKCLGWTANVLICYDENNVKKPPPQSNGRQKRRKNQQNQQCCLFSDCFSTVTNSFLFIPLVLVAGAFQGEHA